VFYGFSCNIAVIFVKRLMRLRSLHLFFNYARFGIVFKTVNDQT
jgi:hypothetical protein